MEHRVISMSFLGTRAGPFSDLTSVIQITGFVILSLGVIYAKRNDFSKHFTLERVSVLLAVIAFLWMGSSLLINFKALIFNLETQSSLLTVFHVIFGIIALLAGIFLAFDRLIKKTRNSMRAMFLLWTAALFLGIAVYMIYYVIR
jgi:uncharacterized membrane protein YozB (DUF420 family)